MRRVYHYSKRPSGVYCAVQVEPSAKESDREQIAARRQRHARSSRVIVANYFLFISNYACTLASAAITDLPFGPRCHLRA